jgi:hypothetical protein
VWELGPWGGPEEKVGPGFDDPGDGRLGDAADGRVVARQVGLHTQPDLHEGRVGRVERAQDHARHHQPRRDHLRPIIHPRQKPIIN